MGQPVSVLYSSGQYHQLQFYVDDCLNSLSSEGEAIRMVKNLTDLYRLLLQAQRFWQTHQCTTFLMPVRRDMSLMRLENSDKRHSSPEKPELHH